MSTILASHKNRKIQLIENFLFWIDITVSLMAIPIPTIASGMANK